MAVDGREATVATYWDQTAAAVGDWQQVWDGELRTSRAFVLVCSPSTAARRDRVDFLFDEIEWWLANRPDVAPIIVNAGDPATAPIPIQVKEHWPNAQWVNWSDDAVERERAIGRIVEGIALAETKVRYQELERTMALLHDAEIARLDALAALNKAEALRLDVEGAGDPEIAALARKYRAQMTDLADRVAALWTRGPRQPEPVVAGVGQKQSVFLVEALDVRRGSCLLVHYGTVARRRFVLIDGGPKALYATRLRPRLDELAAEYGNGGPLELEAVISTQADEGESGGIQRLLAELLDGTGPAVSIRRFWTNTFDPFDSYDPDRGPVMGALQVYHLARQLGLPVNKPFDHFVSQPRLGAPQVEFAAGLTVTVLGPRGAFADYWIREVARAMVKRGRDLPVRRPEKDVVETVSSSEIYLRPSPIRIPDLDPGHSSERSSRNRASIVMLLEFSGRRILLTSDAAGDDLIPAAAQAGIFDRPDPVPLDLLSVPHYGSRHNTDRRFFAAVKSRRYLFQCNDRFRLPSPEVIQQLADARRGDDYEAYFTFTRQEQQSENYRRQQQAINAAQQGGGFHARWRQPDTQSLVIDLAPEA